MYKLINYIRRLWRDWMEVFYEKTPHGTYLIQVKCYRGHRRRLLLWATLGKRSQKLDTETNEHV